MFNEIRNIKSAKKELREFGLTIGIVLVALGSVALWRGKDIYPYLLGPGVFLIGAGVIFPQLLKPLQKAWMAFSIMLGFVMSHLILIVFFYLVVTPIGLITKMLGKDILDERICKEKSSYWNDRDPKSKSRQSYENQF